MYRLRKKRPPFGTAESPIWEYAYSEQVKVVDGFCDVEKETTRDYLLKIGYEEVEVELAAVGPSLNGHSEDSSAEDSALDLTPQRKPKPKKKNRR